MKKRLFGLGLALSVTISLAVLISPTAFAAWGDIKFGSNGDTLTYQGKQFRLIELNSANSDTIPRPEGSNAPGPGGTTGPIWVPTYQEAAASADDGCRDRIVMYTTANNGAGTPDTWAKDKSQAWLRPSVARPDISGGCAPAAQQVIASPTDTPDPSGDPDNGGGGTADDAPVCSAGALGWVLCPLSEAIISATEGIAGLLQSILIFEPLIGTEQGNAIKAIWSLLLTIANVGLVLALLVVIFSQATSVGLSKYGIKRILPRIVAAAILMNLSFYICAVAIDISNILGVSVKGIADAGLTQIAQNGLDPDLKNGAGIGEWLTVSAGGLLAVAIGVGTGAIFLLLPVVMGGVIAAFTALAIIAVRQVLLMLLVIVAPLAFLAWILPNTEEYFTKWRKIFTVLLLMFPLVMTIFHGSILMSSVILSAGGGNGGSYKEFTTRILAFIVLFVPLFSLPFIMRSVGGILERFGAVTNNRGKGFIDRTRKFANEQKAETSYQRGRELRKRASNEFKSTKFASRLGKGGMTGVLARGVSGNIGRSEALRDTRFGAQNARLDTYAVAAERKAASERRQSIREGLRSEGVDAKVLQGRVLESFQKGDVDSTNAQLAHLATTYGSGGRKAAADALQAMNLANVSGDASTRQKMATELDETVGGELYSSLIGSRADIAKGGFRGNDQFGFTDISKLTAPQIASQDSDVFTRGAGRQQTYNSDEAYLAMTNPELVSKISDSTTRGELSRLSGVPIRPGSPIASGAPTVAGGGAGTVASAAAVGAAAGAAAGAGTAQAQTPSPQAAQPVPMTDFGSGGFVAAAQQAQQPAQTVQPPQPTFVQPGGFQPPIASYQPAAAQAAAPVVVTTNPAGQVQSVVNNSVTNVESRNTTNVTAPYGDNLNAFDAAGISSLMNNSGGGVNRLTDYDLNNISKRVKNESSPEFQQINQIVNNEGLRRGGQAQARRANDSAYSSYTNNTPPPTPPPNGNGS